MFVVNRFTRQKIGVILDSHPKKMRKGFTLIELLIVITILGVLASVVTFGMIGQQRKARDAQRKSDLKQVKTALEASKLDCRSSAFYNTGISTTPSDNEINAYSSELITYLIDADSRYLKKAMVDPKNSTTYYYAFKTSTTSNTPPAVASVCPNAATPPAKDTNYGTPNYVLRAKLEITTDPEAEKSRTKCANKINAMTWGVSGDGNAPTANDGFYYACNN